MSNIVCFHPGLLPKQLNVHAWVSTHSQFGDFPRSIIIMATFSFYRSVRLAFSFWPCFADGGKVFILKYCPLIKAITKGQPPTQHTAIWFVCPFHSVSLCNLLHKVGCKHVWLQKVTHAPFHCHTTVVNKQFYPYPHWLMINNYILAHTGWW